MKHVRIVLSLIPLSIVIAILVLSLWGGPLLLWLIGQPWTSGTRHYPRTQLRAIPQSVLVLHAPYPVEFFETDADAPPGASFLDNVRPSVGFLIHGVSGYVLAGPSTAMAQLPHEDVDIPPEVVAELSGSTHGVSWQWSDRANRLCTLSISSDGTVFVLICGFDCEHNRICIDFILAKN